MNVWLERWEKENWWALEVFSVSPPKIKSPKFGEIYREKIGMGKSKGKMTHLPLTMHMVRWFSSFLFFFLENYTLPTCSLLKKHFTYLGFKKWHFAHLWSDPLAKRYPPLTLQLLLTPIHSKKNKKKIPCTWDRKSVV